MKTIPTVEGKFYCVATSTSCDVTTEAGTLLGTAVAGQPLWFQAQKGDTTTLSDDNAEYSASRFNSAPQQQLAVIGVLGGTDGLPAGYTRLAYLESTGTQYCKISTEVGSELFRSETDVLFTTEGLLQIMGFSTYARYYWGVSTSGLYTLGGGNELQGIQSNDRRLVIFENVDNTSRLETDGKAISRTVNETKQDRTQYGVWGPASTHVAVNFCSAKIFSLKLFKANQLSSELLPAVDSSGAPCLFDRVMLQPFYNEGSGSFIVGIDSQSQLNKLLRRLPDRTELDVGTLTVRLADALQTDSNRASMDAMVTKNWEITEAA